MSMDSGDDRRVEFISEEARLAHEAVVARYRREIGTMKVWSGTLGAVLIGVLGFSGWVLFGEREEPHPACPNQAELLQDRPNRFDIIFKEIRLVMVHDEERQVIDCVWVRESELESVVKSRHIGNK